MTASLHHRREAGASYSRQIIGLREGPAGAGGQPALLCDAAAEVMAISEDAVKAENSRSVVNMIEHIGPAGVFYRRNATSNSDCRSYAYVLRALCARRACTWRCSVDR